MTIPPDLREAEQQCAAEPIHRLGRSQSHGVILVCDEQEARIRYCSQNTGEHLGIEASALIGRSLSDVHPALDALVLRTRLHTLWPDGSPVRGMTRVPLRSSFEAVVHRWDGQLLVELQPAHDSDEPHRADPSEFIDSLALRLGVAVDVAHLCSLACEEIQNIIGYRRVLAYEFDADWNGEVIAEQTRAGLPLEFLGLHFPASDIPPQARALYESVHLRVIADAHDEGTPLVGHDDLVATPDLSHALLRSVSSMHLQYLRNMGVRASISVSLLVNGRLWGMLVAHDDVPRVPPQNAVHELRAICRMMGQLVSARLLALDYRRQQVDDRALMNLLERIQTVSMFHRDVSPSWIALHRDITAWFQADGAVLIHDGRVMGDAGEHSSLLRQCIEHFRHGEHSEPVAVSNLAKAGVVPAGSAVAGALWVPVGQRGSALLMWRNEITRDIFWGGDPNKAMDVDANGTTLGPRRSFDKWREVRTDESLPWTPIQLDGAARVGTQWRLLIVDEERRKAEATIRLLESGIMRIQDGFMIAKSMSQGGLEVVLANPLFDALINRGRTCIGTMPPFLDNTLVKAEVCEAIQREVAQGRAADFEFQTSDGRWMTLSLTPIHDADGHAEFWATILRDISNQKSAEAHLVEQSKALQDANDRYTRILESSHEGIITITENGLVDYCNPRMTEILGSITPLVGRVFPSLFADPAEAETLLLASPANSGISRVEATLLHGFGCNVVCDIALIPMRRLAQQRSGWLAMVSDISERRSLENSLLLLNSSLESTVAERTAELVSAKESADAANKAKSEFLANMSHELRSPLHSILGFTKLLIEDDGIPEDRQSIYLTKVEKNASNLLFLVNDLLDSAKIEAQSFSIESVRFNFIEITQLVVTEFQRDGGASSNIRLSLPPVAACTGDPMRVGQVIRNLLANARRFSPSGSEIDISIDRDTGGWRFSVKDRGPGIPPNELESIFERFAQSSSTKTGAGGTGLGLQIAKGIVDSHGGWIRATNREGGGAVFQFFLPDQS